MRKLPLGVAISTIVHAVVVVCVAARWQAGAPAAPIAAAKPEAVVEIVEVKPAEAAPMEITLLDEPVAMAAPPTAPATPPIAPAAERAPSSPAVAAPAAKIASSPPGRAAIEDTARGGDAPGDGSAAPSKGLLAMRRGAAATGPALLRPELPAGQWDAYDHVPKGSAPEVEVHSGQLRDNGAAGKTANQGVFVGKVNPDGTVKITDSANLHIHLALPSASDVATGLQSWYYNDKTPGAGARDGKANAPLARSLQVTPGATTNTGDPAQPQDHATTGIVPILAGGFDITDAMMRRHGADPYASKKLKFLDSTRDERVQMGNKHRAEQLARAPQIMQQNLQALWAARLDLAARKRALFELWDECVETGDAAAIAAGQAARRLVIGFIRGHLPAGSADAYTAAELAALAHKQQSKATFEPYETGSAAP